MDVTFNESVTVTATSTAKPRIALEMGSETVWAVWKTGQGAGAVHRFEYTVAEGDLDTDGVAVKRNSLETPTGSSIVTTDDSEEVSLGHGLRQDPARPVDGVRPTAMSARSEGPSVSVEWSEALDPGAIPSGAGGFSVDVPGASNPTVTAIAVVGNVVTLSLNAPIALGTTGVTANYRPTSTPLRDTAGNAATAFANALAVTVAADETAPVLTAAVVDGPLLTLIYNEPLKATSPVDSGGDQVFAVATVGVGSSLFTVSGARAGVGPGNTRVTMTLDPPARGGQTLDVQYRTTATAASRVQDLAGNAAAGFTVLSELDTPIVVDNRTPSVKGLPVFAGTAQGYAIGDKVAVEVEFTESVSVTTTSSARPEIGIEIGTNTRKAGYVSGSGSARLRFEYAVVAGDADTDGIAIPANALATPTGSAIRTAAGNREVQLAHDAVDADTARTVDGVRPSATQAAVAGPTVTVIWSEALDESSVPTGAGGFVVRIGNTDGPAVNAVSVAGSTATLSLAAAIADGTANVTLEYTPPGSGAKIRDAAGNDAAAILRADALAVTVTPDTRAPEVSGMPTVDGATLKITFDEALDTSSVPAAPGGFTVTVTRGGSAVSGHTVSTLSLSSDGTVLTLTLALAVRGGDEVTLAYEPPGTNPLQDRATTPNPVAGFTSADAKDVENRTPSVKGLPVFAGGAATYAIGEVIAVEVTFTEAVSATTTSSARPEIGIEIDTNTRKARYVSGSGSVKLRFEYAVAEGDADTDGIAIAANALAAPTGSAIRTTTGNRAVQLAHDGVAADAERTVDGVRPTTTAAVAEGLTIEVTWSEALDPASARSDAGGFRVKIGTGNGPAVTAVAVDGTDATKLRLTLADRIADGTQNATLEYRPPSSGAKVRDAAGNDAEGFTGGDAVAVSVTPDTTAPMLAAAAVDGARLTLTFDEPLDEASVPAAPGGFTVTVTRDGNAVPGHTVSGIAVSGATVTLTLAKGVLPGDTVTLDYVPTTTPLQDRAVTPNPVAGFTGVDMKMVDNASDALEVSLSTTEALEGDDRTVTLTVAVAGGGTSGVARVIAITPETAPTAAESEDWTLPAGERTLTLGAGERSAAATIAVVDDARLEIEETVSFAVTADGAAIGQVTLTIADDDRAVLEVSGPDGPATEGQPIELTLRLEPHPENVANVAAVPDDACILDFPVTATLTRSGDTGALPSNAALETEHTFAATAFDDCTREVTVSVPTKASDGVWMVDRALTFALSPQAGSDPRVDAGEALQATVRDDTPKPGPVVTQIELSPVPPEATADHSGPYRKEDFLALPDAAVHGFGAQLMFTITFDIDVTVTLGVTTGGVPELVLDIFGRERRARYTGAGGSGLRTMAFAWTVEQGDYDPNGLAVTGLVVNGATIRDTQDRDTSPETFPAKHFKAHRVRGGLFAMSLDVKGPAEEGEPIEIRVVREGGTEQAVGALIEITDSGMEDLRPEDVPQDQPIEIDGVRLVGVFFEAEDNTRDIDPSFVTYRMIPPGDGKTNATRTLTFELVATDIRDGDGPKSWYNVGNGEATISVLESGTGTGGPGLSVGPADAFEEPGAVLAFEVSLDATSSNDVSVDYTTRDGTAEAGEDYTTTSGTLTFAPGETVQMVEVPVHTDSNMEDVETVWLDLSNPLGAVIVHGEQLRSDPQHHTGRAAKSTRRTQGKPARSERSLDGRQDRRGDRDLQRGGRGEDQRRNPDHRDQSGYIQDP